MPKWLDKYSKKTICSMRYILLGTVLLSSLLFLQDSRRELPKNDSGESLVARNLYGGGSREEKLHATVDGVTLEDPLTLTVRERAYESTELQKVFAEAGKSLEKLILGKNKSLGEVRSNLNLVTQIPDTSIEVSWETDNYKVLNASGEIQKEALMPEGTMVKLSALLSYEEEEALHTCYVKIYPPILTDSEKLLGKLRKAAIAQDEKTRAEKMLVLPAEVDGRQVTWKSSKEQRGGAVLILGIVLAGGMLLLDNQRHIQDIKEQKAQMMRDYPNVINTFMILVGAGMTVRNAWAKMVTEYEQKRVPTKKRYAYEEMLYTWHEIQGGVAESECYERFGRRCKLPSYLKFGALLSQNLRKGSKGLVEILVRESTDAFEERKSQAKKAGEEAGTKLLLPMFGMLVIVLIIVIIPAFFSIQL